MTIYYTEREERLLAEDRAKDAAIEQAHGHKPVSSEERDRLWKAIEDASRH